LQPRPVRYSTARHVSECPRMTAGDRGSPPLLARKWHVPTRLGPG
jgi:hypothetical protein